MIQGAQGWCTAMTQRDGMGMEVGRGVQDAHEEKQDRGSLQNKNQSYYMIQQSHSWAHIQKRHLGCLMYKVLYYSIIYKFVHYQNPNQYVSLKEKTVEKFY